MNRLALLLCFACVQCGPIPAHALEIDGTKITLSQSEAAVCLLDGCVLMTNDTFERMRETIRVLTNALAKGCRKDSV